MILSHGFPISPRFPNITPNLFPDPTTFAGQPFYVDNNAGRPVRQVQWSIEEREVIPNVALEGRNWRRQSRHGRDQCAERL